MIHSPNFAKCLQETEFMFHCVWYIEPVYSTGRVAISQKANEIQFEFPTKNNRQNDSTQCHNT